MSWKPINLRGISFLGHKKKPALLEFESGLNVICGASDTGKSFIIEAVDYIFAGTTLKEIKERTGYDVARLALETSSKASLTLQRSVEGGDISLVNKYQITGEWPEESTLLSAGNPKVGQDSLSLHLLSKIGLSEKSLLKNKKGELRRLGFRALLKLVLIDESNIIKKSSPFLTGQYTQQTYEESLFKLLVTGVDSSSLKEHSKGISKAKKAEEQTSQIRAKVLTEFIDELSKELIESQFTREQATIRLVTLTNATDPARTSLDKLQKQIRVFATNRHNLWREQNKHVTRMDEIKGLLARFELLEKHYRVDIDRLSSIEESGSMIQFLDERQCPLCGSAPEHHHNMDTSTKVIGDLVVAAQAEIEKIHLLVNELRQTNAALLSELDDLKVFDLSLHDQIEGLNSEISNAENLLTEGQGYFTGLIVEISSLQSLLSKFERLEHLERSRQENVIQVVVDDPEEDSESKIEIIDVNVSTSAVDEYAATVQKLLEAWGFPRVDRVHFDAEAYDLIIDGQARASRGKGLRAITHAAMSIGLMEFCKTRDLSHPGFVMLDSPLLAYSEPEGEEDVQLAGTDLKERFYEYLAKNLKDEQVTIIENQHPPLEVRDQIKFTDFTKNPNEGRYGFFPLSSIIEE